MQFDGDHWRNNLLLRQYLRTSVDARERYATAKLAAVSAGASNLVAYSGAKAACVEQLLAEARVELLPDVSPSARSWGGAREGRGDL